MTFCSKTAKLKNSTLVTSFLRDTAWPYCSVVLSNYFLLSVALSSSTEGQLLRCHLVTGCCRKHQAPKEKNHFSYITADRVPI